MWGRQPPLLVHIWRSSKKQRMITQQPNSTGLGINPINLSETIADNPHERMTIKRTINDKGILVHKKKSFCSIFWVSGFGPSSSRDCRDRSTPLFPHLTFTNLAKNNNQPMFGAGLAQFYLLGIWGRKREIKEERVGLQIFEANWELNFRFKIKLF